jgi:hypothetical protein
MSFSVNFQEMVGVDVGVALRSRQAHVAQQFLDRAQVRTTLKEVGCEAMA